MFAGLAKRIFGSASDRFIKSLNKTVADVNALEPQVQALSDDELKARTVWLRERLAKGEDLDDVLVDAFATMREAVADIIQEKTGHRPTWPDGLQVAPEHERAGHS